MKIRKIELRDSENFLNMLNKLDTETKYMMFEPGERQTSIDEMMSRIRNIEASNSLILVVENNSDIVGFLSAERGFANRIKHSAYIVVGLLKDYRGKGISNKLFEELEKWAINNSITRLELTVIKENEAALHLYKKMGFKVEGLKEKSLIIDGSYVDEYYMAKIL